MDEVGVEEPRGETMEPVRGERGEGSSLPVRPSLAFDLVALRQSGDEDRAVRGSQVSMEQRVEIAGDALHPVHDPVLFLAGNSRLDREAVSGSPDGGAALAEASQAH